MTFEPELAITARPKDGYVQRTNSDIHEDHDGDLLRKLAEDKGFQDADEMLSHFITDSLGPAICTECGEEHEEELEQDAENIECENCGLNGVSSIFVVAGIN